MGIIYHCFWECNNSLAMYFLPAECGFMKTRKKQWGQQRQDAISEKSSNGARVKGDEVSNGTEMEIERHKIKKGLMNFLQLQGERYGFIITVGRSWQNH